MARVSVKAPSKNRTEFKFNAPSANDVRLVGSFTNWEQNPIRMRKGVSGEWKAWVELSSGRHEYKFIVDGQWQNDPCCPSCVPNTLGGYNCVVEVF